MNRRGILPLAEAFGPGINRSARHALKSLNGIADRSRGSEADPGQVARHDFNARNIRILCSAVKRLNNIDQPRRFRALAGKKPHVCREESHGIRLNNRAPQIKHHYRTGTYGRSLRLRPIPQARRKYEDAVKDHIKDKPSKKVEAPSDPA